jgi:hypothetical protein
MKTIPLTNGGFTLVDDEDFDSLSRFKWRQDRGYVWRFSTVAEGMRKRRVVMHRVITNAPDGMLVDHANRDKLDNRKANLRVCTETENHHNQHRDPSKKKSAYKGVSPNRGATWRARITVNKTLIHLGTFVNQVDAAKAYDKAAIEFFGEYARPYFTEEKQQDLMAHHHESYSNFSLS